SMGFGVGRMGMMNMKPRAKDLKPRQDETKPPQPGHLSAEDAWLAPALAVTTTSALTDLHEAGVINFVNPAGFGVFENRQKVIGFAPHSFNEVPKSGTEWQVETLELVSLLLHSEAAVYLSHRLPAMDELKDAPTRKPDGFEAAALERIKKGDDLV